MVHYPRNEITSSSKSYSTLHDINLQWIFKQNQDDLLQFLAHHRLVKNELNCHGCKKKMSFVKRTAKLDGFEWHCARCKTRKSVRDGSFFHNSMLSITQMFILVYMWIEDFRNKNVIKELGLSKDTVVNWFNYCRQQCSTQQPIGGQGLTVEIDETCWVKQKHNRGKPKRGTQMWYFGGIERGKGGQAFCIRVKNRKKKTLYKLIKRWICEGSIIISDEWPAYLRLSRDLPQYEHCLIRHKKATGGGFSKIIKLKNGTEFNVNTNKCEGLWAQLKQKTKRIHGTNTNLTDSYMLEQLFRQNSRAREENLFDAFVKLLKGKYNVE